MTVKGLQPSKSSCMVYGVDLGKLLIYWSEKW